MMETNYRDSINCKASASREIRRKLKRVAPHRHCRRIERNALRCVPNLEQPWGAT
jgi:hypothetical protein